MNRLPRWCTAALLAMQVIAGIRVVVRLLTTSRGVRIQTVRQVSAAAGPVTVIVPVLNEASRLVPCLEGLMLQGPDVVEIIVVDGGSADGTRDIVRRFAERDLRIRLVDASPIPDDWNGKPWGLHVGLRRASDETRWVLTIDADVRPKPALVPSLLTHAERHSLRAMSVATPQEVGGVAEAVVHTSLLTTLVYRYGIPGGATSDPEAVQANGQCFLIERALLDGVGGFASVAQSVVEDVTLARHCARLGEPVGFYEPEDASALVTVEMYDGWYDALVNWSRSLPMRDRYFGWRSWLRMAEMALAMGMPPVALLVSALWSGMPRRSIVARVNAVLLITRLGTQFGIRRAYAALPNTHWAAIPIDPVIVTLIVARAFRRRHRWRGREVGVERRTGNQTVNPDESAARNEHAADACAIG